MNCTEIRPLLSAYYDGEATPDERAQIERHLATCPDCRHVLAEYRVIGSDIRALPVPAVPAGLRRDVWKRIDAQRSVPRILPMPSPRGKVITLPDRTPKAAVPLT